MPGFQIDSSHYKSALYRKVTLHSSRNVFEQHRVQGLNVYRYGPQQFARCWTCRTSFWSGVHVGVMKSRNVAIEPSLT